VATSQFAISKSGKLAGCSSVLPSVPPARLGGWRLFLATMSVTKESTLSKPVVSKLKLTDTQSAIRNKLRHITSHSI